MYKKLSVLDRKLRPGSARPNLETSDAQYAKEQEKLKGKQDIWNENHERVRKCTLKRDLEWLLSFGLFDLKRRLNMTVYHVLHSCNWNIVMYSII